MRTREFGVVTTVTCGGLLALAACGGPSRARTPGPSADAGVATDAATMTAKAPPLGPLPPMAEMPTRGVAHSRKVDVREASPKMTPLGEPVRATQADRDPHQEHKVHVARGRCVRAVVSADPPTSKVVLVARDDAGDIVAESSSGTVPEQGVMCAKDEGDVTILVGVGRGKATYTLQAFGD